MDHNRAEPEQFGKAAEWLHKDIMKSRYDALAKLR